MLTLRYMAALRFCLAMPIPKRIPDSDEIREQVALCRAWLVRQGLCSYL